MFTYRLHNHDDQLEEENEKEEHKVCTAVVFESLVCGTVPIVWRSKVVNNVVYYEFAGHSPTKERCRREQHSVKKSKEKVCKHSVLKHN